MELTQRDKKHIWHPYTQAKTDGTPIPIMKGKGAWLVSEDGKKYLDAVSSWWVNIHGHAHPYIAKKIAKQAKKLEQVIFAGFTHEPAIRLAERLIKLLPGDYGKVFYSDNGSTAVEVALKMALQYWHNKGAQKTKIIAFKNSYHGDTFGAMSASDRSVFTNPFASLLFEVVHIEPPLPGREEESIKQLKAAVGSGSRQADSLATRPSSHVTEKAAVGSGSEQADSLATRPSSHVTEKAAIGSGSEQADSLATRPSSHVPPVAAFIFEPLVLGAGGMLMYNAKPLDEMIALCRKHNVLTIADEVMTGFGRTGKLFATNYLKNQPDIICLSKGITGGFMPLGVTVCTEEIYKPFHNDNRLKTFFHGHSYTANPLACAAANASLDLMEEKDFKKSLHRITTAHKAFAKKLQRIERVENVRVQGTIIAFDLKTKSTTSYLNPERNKIYEFFIERGILLRPLGNTIYVMPPVCISGKELELIYKSILKFLNN